MPQLEVGTFPMQLFWLAITFLVLFVLMAYVALPKVGKVIEARTSKIDGDLAAAQNARIRTESLMAEVEKALAESRAAAQSVIRDATSKAQAEATKAETELGKELAAQAASAERRIAAARESALADVKTIAAEVASATVTRLTGAEVEALTAASTVQAVLAQKA